MCLSDDHSSSRGASTTTLRSTTMRKDGYRASPIYPVKSFKVSEESPVLGLVLGTAVSIGTVIFSLFLPHVMTPQAAKEIYVPAFYSYDPLWHHFDNTIWTYGTDYALAVVMGTLAYRCLRAQSEATKLKRRAAGLLICYALSVLAGGLAHQFYTTIEARNSLSFRILWTICVGTVTAAGGFMGSSGSEVARHFGGKVVPEWLWIGFGVFTTAICVCGYISFQRPACDIFIAGITQVPPTAYMMGLGFFVLKNKVSEFYRWQCIVAFILNAPLLPMYSLLVHSTELSLATINTLLHTWLLVAWGNQSLSLLHLISKVQKTE